jgi:hypothetical protein
MWLLTRRLSAEWRDFVVGSFLAMLMGRELAKNMESPSSFNVVKS